MSGAGAFWCCPTAFVWTDLEQNSLVHSWSETIPIQIHGNSPTNPVMLSSLWLLP